MFRQLSTIHRRPYGSGGLIISVSKKKEKIYHQYLIKRKYCIICYSYQLICRELLHRSFTIAVLTPQGLIPVQPASLAPVVIEVSAYDTALDWIGFTIPEQRAAIMADITELEDYADLKEKHIQYLADGFARRTVLDSRLIV